MFDELIGGEKGVFEVGGGTFEVTTAIRSHSRLQTMWVYGLHWPRCCECDGPHAPIAFGEGHFQGKFHIANFDFWANAVVDVRAIEAAFNHWLTTGELPDSVQVSAPLSPGPTRRPLRPRSGVGGRGKQAPGPFFVGATARRGPQRRPAACATTAPIGLEKRIKGMSVYLCSVNGH